jgi:hypothetical protein
MSINTRSATAIVRFTGLGILCFNPRKKRAENLFIHDEGHTLSIEIYKPFSAAKSSELAGSGRDEIPMDNKEFDGNWYRLIASYSNLDQSQLTRNLDRVDLSIDVSGLGSPEIEGYKRYEPCGFDRLATGDDVDHEDFRWMVNVQKDGIFGTGPLAPVATVEAPSTKLFISNAEFYTASIAKDDPETNDQGEILPATDMFFKKIPLVSDGADESAKIDASKNATNFGRMGSDVGAAINADHVQVKIKVGDEEHIHMLPRIHRPYVVYIKNNASDAESDIPIYRKFWQPTDEAFDLLTPSEITNQLTGGDFSGARVMCNGVVVEEPASIPPFNGDDGPEG